MLDGLEQQNTIRQIGFAPTDISIYGTTFESSLYYT